MAPEFPTYLIKLQTIDYSSARQSTDHNSTASDLKSKYDDADELVTTGTNTFLFKGSRPQVTGVAISRSPVIGDA